jgi:phytoene dehydrogenase-like protein
MTDYDAVIIGAGHNGLTCAGYLAKAGKKVLVVDGRSEPGGCASTREFTPGFNVSDCAQWLSQLDQSIVKDLDLRGAGLSTKPKPPFRCSPTVIISSWTETRSAAPAWMQSIKRPTGTSGGWFVASPSS